MSASLLALLLGLRSAAPEPPPAPPPLPAALELRWDAPRECPDRAQLLAAIEATLGEVGAGERRPVTVRGRVRSEPGPGFVVELELDDGRASTRALRGASCQELTEAAALVIAMTIDPRLLERMPPEVPEQPVTGPATNEPPASEPQTTKPTANEPLGSPRPLDEPPASERSARPRPSPEPPPTSLRNPASLRWLGRVEAGVGGGPLPGAAAVLGVATGVGGRGWRVELTASYWTPRTRSSAINPAIGVRAQLWTVGGLGCGEPRWRTLAFPLCAGISAGAVHARGVGALVPRTVATRWVAASAEPGVVWWVRPRLGLTARLVGHVALARPALRSEPSGTVFMSAPVAGAASAGVELRLP